MFRNPFTHKKTQPPAPSTEAIQAMELANEKLVEAVATLETAITVADKLQQQHEANHFRERWILALTGGE